MFFEDRPVIEMITVPPLTLLIAMALVALAPQPRAPAGRFAGPQYVMAAAAGGPSWH